MLGRDENLPHNEDSESEKNSGRSRSPREREFDSSIKLAAGTEEGIELLMSSLPPELSSLPSEQILLRHDIWCKSRHVGHKPVIHFSLDEIPDPFEATFYDFFGSIFAEHHELPEDSPLRLARPPLLVQGYEVQLPRKETMFVALLELMNVDGNYLTFNGESLELVREGPAFVQLSQYKETGRAHPKMPQVIYSREAFRERLSALRRIALPEVQQTCSEDSYPHLLTEIELSIQSHFPLSSDAFFPEPDEMTFIGDPNEDPESPLLYETPMGEIYATPVLGKFGLPHFEISRH